MPDRWDDRHPLRNPDVLERYAMGRLPSPERNAIDEHCRECPECRRLLEDELRLAAGVRHAARSQMKMRLAERLSLSGRPEVPWPRIAAIAATILIVAGLSVVGIWLQQRYTVQSPPPEVATPKEQLSDRATTPQEKGSIIGKKDIARAEQSARAATGESKIRNEEAGKETERVTNGVPSPGASARATLSEGYWTEGIISEEPATAGAAYRDELDNVRRPAPETRTRAAQKSAATTATPDQQVLLSQQPSRLLQGQEQQQAKRKGLPTLVRQVDGQLILTLYPDSLFPPQELRQAIVRRSGDDSLLIQVGNQLIRYRLPSSLIQQVPAR